MIDMIGVGPFITIPLMVATMHGPQAMLGWILGAVLVVCDGMVWAELGAAMPQAGGPSATCRRCSPVVRGRWLSFPLRLAAHVQRAALDGLGLHRLRAVCRLPVARR
jgi:amino acid transporter